MNDLDKQTSRIILLRGALELIANSSDIVFTKAWAQRALDRDLENRPTLRAADALPCSHDWEIITSSLAVCRLCGERR